MTLAEARKGLAALENNLGYDRLAVDLEYQVAQEKVDNLSERMEGLTDRLSLLIGENVEKSEVTGYLVAAKPSMPYPLLPERPSAKNTLMMGAIAGIAIAWGLLNFKWISKGMPSSSQARTKEEDEEGAA